MPRRRKGGLGQKKQAQQQNLPEEEKVQNSELKLETDEASEKEGKSEENGKEQESKRETLKSPSEETNVQLEAETKVSINAGNQSTGSRKCTSLTEDLPPLKTDRKQNEQTDRKTPFKPDKEQNYQTKREAPFKTDKEQNEQTGVKAPFKTDKEQNEQTGVKASFKSDKEQNEQTEVKVPIKSDKKQNGQTEVKAPFKTDRKQNEQTEVKAPFKSDKGQNEHTEVKAPFKSDKERNEQTEVKAPFKTDKEQNEQTEVKVLYERLNEEEEPVAEMPTAFMYSRAIPSLLRQAQTEWEERKKKKKICPRPVKAKVLTAMSQAHEAMDLYLRNENCGIYPQQLADWFGKCALILHEIHFFIPAIRCFYAAIVFDANWTIEDHKPVAKTLWDALLLQKDLHPMIMGIVNVFERILELAQLALGFKKYMLGSIICRELDAAYRSLLKHHNVWPMEGRTTLEVYYAVIKPVVLCNAECQLHLENYVLVKTICAAVLKDMCDYDCPLAFELWGKALLKEGELEVARMKIESAILFAQTEDYKSKLEQLLQETLADEACGIDDTIQNKGKPNTVESSDKPQQDKDGAVSQGKKTGLSHNSQRKEKIEAPRFHERNRTTNRARTSRGSLDRTPVLDAGDEFERLQLCTDTTNTEDVFEEGSSFYDQSCLFYSQHDRKKPTTDEELLQFGIKLNMSFMAVFQDKHHSNYTRTPYYSQLTDEKELEQKLKRHEKFISCELQIESAHLSFCKPLEPVPNVDKIEISGRSKAGQAFSGDEVVVKLIDKSHDSEGKRYGEVVGILDRNRYKGVDHPVFICNLDDMETHLMRPICKTLPKISVLNQTIRNKWPRLKKYLIEVYTYDAESETLLGDPELMTVNLGDIQRYVFLVAYINWSPRHIYPRGAVIKVLPCGDTLSTGLRLLGLQHHVPSLYQKQVVNYIEETMPDLISEIRPEDYPDRQNLTDSTCFTIDPEGSKDLDDALSIQKVKDGYRVGVHIADVSYFVRKDDPCDQEARSRATTYYPGIGRLPHPMLPEPLSNHVCSLLPNTCRLTISVIITITKTSTKAPISKMSFDIRKTIIKSSQQFTYKEVQSIITGREHKFSQEIRWLYELATDLRRERLGNAMFAVDLSNEDNESDDDIVEALEAHYLIEEFMILANKSVAEKLTNHFPRCIPLRTQPPPSKENMDTFLQKHGSLIDVLVKLQDKQLSADRTSHIGNILGPMIESNEEDNTNIIVPRHIWQMAESCSNSEREHCDDFVKKVLCIDDLYPLQHLIYQEWLSFRKSAEYLCNGKWSRNYLHHYELQLYPYTHFTSPIRRYIDLVIHRLIHAYLDEKPSPYTSADIDNICNHVNAKTKQAKTYQRNCQLLKHAIELKKKPKMTLAFVNDLSDRSVTLSSFDLKHVKKDNKELPFNLLDMGYKPEVVKDPVTNKDTIKAIWRKRLYDFNSQKKPFSDVKSEGQSNTDKKLNPHEGVVYIPIRQWTRILKCAMSGHKQDMKKCIKDTTATILGRGYTQDVSTEAQNIAKNPSTTFSLTFSHGQTLKTQLTAVPMKGILTPKPMLYNMTNNVKLCLQHIDDAVLYLSEYVCKPTCDQYRNLSMYIERWIPIIHMEAATCAVANEESCVINNVPVEFVNRNEGKMTFSADFCEIRNIEFSGTISEVNEEDEQECFQAYDWLCIRYVGSESKTGTQQSTPKLLPALKPVWVGHAEITGVRKQEDDKKTKSNGKVNKKKTNNFGKSNEKKTEQDGKIVVKFKFHKLCPSLQDEMLRKDARFCVEILCKSEVDRRTESFLKKLEDEPYQDILAQKIALNRPIPSLDKLHVDMANCIEQDLNIRPSSAVVPLPRNNVKQQEAIYKALRNRVTLIQGPPGTGKTYTGIKLLYLFDRINTMITKEGRGPQKQVLFCGPSNKAVDVVAKMMLTKLGPLCPKFVRVYGRSIEALDYPIPGRMFFSKKSTRASKTDELLVEYALHHLIRKPDRPSAKEINAYDQQFKRNEYVASPEEVKEYVKLLSAASIEELKSYSVILCTTGVGSNPKILKASSVYQVVVDEAGMCSEPECLLPIIATKAEQVVLIGDHKQLRPIIICKRAAELGLEKSLFERYAYSRSAEKVQFTMLNKQYRMNPELCHFPSKQFYEGKLQTENCISWRNDRLAHIWPVNEQTGNWFPHVLIHVEGEEESLAVSTEEGNEQSKSNMEEVEIAVKLFRFFIDEGVEGDKINVISQYNAQCAQIRKKIQEEGFVNFNVSTVVSSQGGEWDYVIFSTVRSLPYYKIEKNPTLGWCKQNLGFITDQNQINVALTRAKKGLIIIGNKNLLRCDEVWKNLISDYEGNDCIKTLNEFPPKRTRMQRQEAAQIRNWDLYGKERFIPGRATSFTGEIPTEDIELEENEGFVRNMKRGMRKTLRQFPSNASSKSERPLKTA